MQLKSSGSQQDKMRSCLLTRAEFAGASRKDFAPECNVLNQAGELHQYFKLSTGSLTYDINLRSSETETTYAILEGKFATQLNIRTKAR